MMRYDPETLVQVKPVRIVALVAGVEGDHLEATAARFGIHKIEQGAGKSQTPISGQGDQVVDVKVFPAKQELEVAVATNGRRFPVGRFGKSQLVAFGNLFADLREQVGADQMRAQFKYDIAATQDVFVRLSESDGDLRHKGSFWG